MRKLSITGKRRTNRGPAGCVEAWRILCCFEGISGADHIARELIVQENMIRRICEIEDTSDWEP